MKVFISTPMHGKTQEQIRAYRQKQINVLKAMYPEEEIEVIDSVVTDTPPQSANESIWYLGKSISLMSGADTLASPYHSTWCNGCRIERNVASSYGLKIIDLPMLPEDDPKLYEDKSIWEF